MALCESAVQTNLCTTWWGKSDGGAKFRYYQQHELIQYLRKYQRLHERELQHAEAVVELWLRKSSKAEPSRPGDGGVRCAPPLRLTPGVR